MCRTIKSYTFKRSLLLIPFYFIRKFCLFPLSVLFSFYADGQFIVGSDTSGTIHFFAETEGIATSNGQIPFWLRTNQYGSIPLDGTSGSILTGTERGYKSGNGKLFDWGIGLEGRLNLGYKAKFILTEAYIKGRLSIFQLQAGRWKEIIGLMDTTLSSGAHAVSGTALGIPKIQISVPQYWDIPLTRKLIGIKGSLSHGWFGMEPLREQDLKVSSVNSYYYEMSVYGRIGKPSWKLKLFGGINHLAMWGNEQQMYGKTSYTMTNLQTWEYIALGKADPRAPTGTAKIGNHLGSIDQGLEYDFRKIDILGYHQFFYDVGGLYHLNNIKDGLFGISVKNKSSSQEKWKWTKILIEYMGSKSQGGGPGAPVTPSGDEDYYNNYLYSQAWAYKGENIGSNFFTNRKYARTDLVERAGEYVINSRLILWHIGIEGIVNTWQYRAKLSWSANYGTYGSSSWGNSTGVTRDPGPPPYFSEVNQFSGFIEAGRDLKKNYHISFAIAADCGSLLYNSIGGFIKISRTW